MCKDERRARRRAYVRKRYAEDTEFRDRRCEYGRTWRARHKAEINDRKKLKRANNPQKYREANRRSYLKQVYGISVEDYEALLASQNGVCAICKKKDRVRLCVDHCHDTRTVRGLFCSKCNIGLGQFDDDIERLRAAIAYLERGRGKK